MLIKRRTHLAIDIPQGGKAPTEIRLFSAGWNDSTKGMHLFDLPASVSVMQEAASWGNRYTFYFKHPELDGRPPEEWKSCGSYLLELRGPAENPELWAVDIQWADGIAEAIERKEWLYFSQAFGYDTETRRVLEFYNCALTNEPATKNARPLLMAASLEKFVGLDISHEQIRDALYALINARFPEEEGAGGYNYLQAVYDDSLVFQRGGKLWKMSYAQAADGSFSLTSGPVEVQASYEPVGPTAPGGYQGLSAIPYRAGPIDDTAGWSGKAAEKSVRDWATKADGSIDWAKYRRAFGWYDESAPEATGSYKLIHHEMQQGELTVSRAGIMAAGSACMGSRGGVDIPEADLEKVKAHLGQHYKAMDMVAPWDRKQQQSSSQAAGANGREPKETSLMDKAFLSTLGLPENATDTEALAKLTRMSANIEELCKVTGKESAAEALGIVSGWKAGAELVAGLQRQVKEQESAVRLSRVNALLDGAPTKVTPAMRPSLLAARKFDSDDDVKWLEGHVAALPEHAALSGAGAGTAKTDAAVSSDPAGGSTKKWEELKPAARADLYRNNKALYDSLKADYQARTNAAA